MNKLVFIDDSGDPGFRFTRGSSRFFVFALICFEDKANAHNISNSIRVLRGALGKDDQFEFKSSKSNNNHKTEFWNVVNEFDYHISAVIVNKEKFRNKSIITNSEHFYNYILHQTINNNRIYLENSSIYVDGNYPKKYKQKIQKYMNNNIVFDNYNLRFINSRTNLMIQMADMAAGAIFQYYERGDDSFYKLIQPKLKSQWNYGWKI